MPLPVACADNLRLHPTCSHCALTRLAQNCHNPPGGTGFINFMGKDGKLLANCKPFAFKVSRAMS